MISTESPPRREHRKTKRTETRGSRGEPSRAGLNVIITIDNRPWSSRRVVSVVNSAHDRLQVPLGISPFFSLPGVVFPRLGRSPGLPLLGTGRRKRRTAAANSASFRASSFNFRSDSIRACLTFATTLDRLDCLHAEPLLKAVFAPVIRTGVQLRSLTTHAFSGDLGFVRFVFVSLGGFVRRDFVNLGEFVRHDFASLGGFVCRGFASLGGFVRCDFASLGGFVCRGFASLGGFVRCIWARRSRQPRKWRRTTDR
jgi:hypothetical protein